ncbi:Aste57867_22095 [Aphanomyces stellatus]|uniref:Amino acid transporter n=1 Tax=Aphanomyces stellatus TaxID=120398 RepID=A0A485LLB1_9STRA|nr:hypothetical protein As57867_022026 [Aphanomyces stellatus]VFT98763.1 Aste57867_22095 [Aphanomyces stellatus]
MAPPSDYDSAKGESHDDFEVSQPTVAALGTRHTHQTTTSTDPDEANERSEKVLNWYLGAPGTLVGTILGVVVGEGVTAVLESQGFEADDLYRVGDFVHQMGQLYFRALMFVTLPLAFFNVSLSIADMVTSKRMFKVRWKLVGLTLLTTVLAVTQALVWTRFVLGDRLNGVTYVEQVASFNLTTYDAFECPSTSTSSSASPTVLTVDNTTNQLVCVPSEKTFGLTKYMHWAPDHRLFHVADRRKVLATKHSVLDVARFESKRAETLNAIFKLAPSNLIDIFSTNNVVGLVLLAVALGNAASLASKKTKGHKSPTSIDPIQVMRELHAIFKTMLSFIVTVTPVAIIPLVAGPLITRIIDARANFPKLVYFVLAFGGAGALHMFLVLPFLLFAFTGTNPYKYLWLVKDALLYSFSCTSSSKSLPVAIRLMDSTDCDRNISRFAGSIGTGINKNGGGAYIVMALVFTFRNGGLLEFFSPGKEAMICANALVASMAVSPVRTGGLAVVMSVFHHLTNLEIMPYAFSFMLIAECIVDPISTVLNLWGNLVVARIIADKKATVTRRPRPTNVA